MYKGIEVIEEKYNVFVVPDAHGNNERLDSINDFLEKFPESNEWIAIEYVLHDLEEHLNEWLSGITIDTEIADDICRTFCNVFIYGEKRDESEPCSKLYAPNIAYARYLIQTLKKFKYVICLETLFRPSIHNEYHTTDNEYWIELIKNKTDTPGVIIVGAMHANVMLMLLYQMQIHLKCNFYTILRNFKKQQNEIVPYNPNMIRDHSTYNNDYVALWSYRSITNHYKQY